jgi:hypothetical protein
MPMNDHDEVLRSLGRLEGKVDQLLDSSKSQGSRILSLEKKVWGFPAIGALVAVLLPKYFPFLPH